MTRFCTGIGSPIGSWILLVGFVPAIAYGAERPDWAFPVTDKIQPLSLVNESDPKPPPGSTKSYTRKQIDDLCNPPDWYPNMHPPMPQIVAHGTETFAAAPVICRPAPVTMNRHILQRFLSPTLSSRWSISRAGQGKGSA